MYGNHHGRTKWLQCCQSNSQWLEALLTYRNLKELQTRNNNQYCFLRLCSQAGFLCRKKQQWIYSRYPRRYHWIPAAYFHSVVVDFAADLNTDQPHLIRMETSTMSDTFSNADLQMHCIRKIRTVQSKNPTPIRFNGRLILVQNIHGFCPKIHWKRRHLNTA